MVVGGGLPTNNVPIKQSPRKEVIEGLFLPHQNGGVGRGLLPPIIEGRPCSFKEHR